MISIEHSSGEPHLSRMCVTDSVQSKACRASSSISSTTRQREDQTLPKKRISRSGTPLEIGLRSEEKGSKHKNLRSEKDAQDVIMGEAKE